MITYQKRQISFLKEFSEKECEKVQYGTLHNIVGKSRFCKMSKGLVHMDLLQTKHFLNISFIVKPT